MRIEITSRANPRIGELLKAKERLFFFEGHKLVLDVLHRGIAVEMLIQQPDWPGAALPVAAREHWIVSQSVMEKLSDLQSAPDVIAVVRGPLRRIDWPGADLVAILDSLQDPGNLGTIFRCAAAFGISGLVLSGCGVRPNHPKLVRAAQTALLEVACESYPGVTEALDQALSAGLSVYLTSPRRGAKALAPTQIRMPAALVFGSEGRGLPAALLTRWPSVTIPMRQGIESLNVGIAAGILFYELGQKRAMPAK